MIFDTQNQRFSTWKTWKIAESDWDEKCWSSTAISAKTPEISDPRYGNH